MVWLGEGADVPGQHNLRGALTRYLGSVNPLPLFLVFSELRDGVDRDGVDRDGETVRQPYMLDQSNNVTSPIKSPMTSTVEVQRIGGVDRYGGVDPSSENNDVLMATQTLKQIYCTDVGAVLAMARCGASDCL